jgi:hypothetical protein
MPKIVNPEPNASFYVEHTTYTQSGSQQMVQQVLSQDPEAFCLHVMHQMLRPKLWSLGAEAKIFFTGFLMPSASGKVQH